MTNLPDGPVPPTAADLLALAARHRVRVWEVGYVVGLHPARVGLFLNERRPLQAEMAQRLQAAIESAAKRKRAR